MFKCCFLLFTEFFSGADGANLPNDATLKELQARVPGVLSEARAESTNKVYIRAYAKWKTWSHKFPEIKILPASPEHVVLYLIFLSDCSTSFSVINIAACAIAWGHRCAGLQSPTESPLVSDVLAGLKKRLFKPRVCKEPFLLVHIHKFLTVMDTTSLTDSRNTVLIVLAFYAFLRSDELLSITFKDVKFVKTHLELYIAKAKTDQLREGRSVLVAKLEGKFCPVSIVQSYYLKAQKYSKLTDFLFRRIIIQEKEAILYSKNVKITYSNLRDIVVRKVGQIGLCSKNYGTHSMRAGGSTLAANNGVPDRLFQRHGRWASVEAKNGYIKDNTEAKLSVTKAMV